MPAARLLLLFSLCVALSACAPRQFVADRVGDALAEGGAAFARDDDPELVRAAAPFSLKLTESLLEESPRHRGLLLAAVRGFTQYGYAFVQQDADMAEDENLARSRELQSRARRLYRRARDYGLRGLEEAPDDPALLYWTGAAWAAWIGLSKDRPEAIADLPEVTALMERALARDESFDRGALHTFFITYEMARPDGGRGAETRARRHFARAVELSGGDDAAPYVALAEAVCVPLQRREEFERRLRQALAIDPSRRPEGRLANLVAQRRARWLLARTDRLFLD